MSKNFEQKQLKAGKISCWKQRSLYTFKRDICSAWQTFNEIQILSNN